MYIFARDKIGKKRWTISDSQHYYSLGIYVVIEREILPQINKQVAAKRLIEQNVIINPSLNVNYKLK